MAPYKGNKARFIQTTPVNPPYTKSIPVASLCADGSNRNQLMATYLWHRDKLQNINEANKEAAASIPRHMQIMRDLKEAMRYSRHG